MGKLRDIISSKQVQNVAKLLSANVVAQVIGLVVYPILSRMYAPEDFGLLNLFLSIGGILTLISLSEYQYAIVLPKQEKHAVSLFHFCIVMLLCSTFIVGFVCVCFPHQIASLFDAPTLAAYLWLMPIYIFVMGLWCLLNYWYTRKKMFTNITLYQVSQSVTCAGSKVSFGWYNILQGGMIYSTIIAPIVALIISCTYRFRSVIQPLTVLSSWQEMKIQCGKYKNFPLFVLPRSFINTVGSNLPALMLTPVFGLSEIGFFGMAFTLAFRPINMICSSIYQVLFQSVTEKINNGEKVLSFIRTYLLRIGLFTIVLFSILYTILPTLTVWLLGEDWQVVSDYIRIMLPWLLLIVLNTSLSFLPDIFNKQHIYTIFEILYIAIRVIVLFIGIHLNSMHYAIILYSIVGVLILSIELLWFISILIKHERTIK